MGSGKSTLGSEVASFFQVPFVDTDDEIASSEGKTIADIFNASGEHQFRLLEKEVLFKTSSYDKAIVATGGGLPCFDENMQWINRNGISIYLQWPPDLLKRNVLSQRKDRPLLSSLSGKNAEEKMEELLAWRLPFYEQAAITIEMTGDQEKDKAVLIKACKYIW